MRYQIKLLFSPAKWLCCMVFIVTLPVTMYVPTYYDFVNVASLYLPFVGIVLLADLNLIDQENGSEEIAFMSNTRPISTSLLRYFIITFLLLGYIFSANLIFRGKQLIQGDNLKESISTLEYILIVSCSSLSFGTLAMLISTIFKNVYIGYGGALVYWEYWNINYKVNSIINPFPFISNPTFYERPMTFLYCIIGVLIFINCILSTKSPFFLHEVTRKLRIKFLGNRKT